MVLEDLAKRLHTRKEEEEGLRRQKRPPEEDAREKDEEKGREGETVRQEERLES